MDNQTSQINDELKARDEVHELWVREVRDPAEKNGEGVRSIKVGGASAEYEIAQLPDGRYALHSSLSYHCGDCHGSGTPWSALESREACVEAFAERALHHFSIKCGSQKQRQAQVAMLRRLDGGLFGFIEPEISEEATKKDREIREVVQYHWKLLEQRNAR